jgi:hypothetical protein
MTRRGISGVGGRATSGAGRDCECLWRGRSVDGASAGVGRGMAMGAGRSARGERVEASVTNVWGTQ